MTHDPGSNLEESPDGHSDIVYPSTTPFLVLHLACFAALWTGVEVANLNYVLEFSGTNDTENGGSSYVAMNSVIINIAGCLGGLSAGVIAKGGA